MRQVTYKGKVVRVVRTGGNNTRIKLRNGSQKVVPNKELKRVKAAAKPKAKPKRKVAAKKKVVAKPKPKVAAKKTASKKARPKRKPPVERTPEPVASPVELQPVQEDPITSHEEDPLQADEEPQEETTIPTEEEGDPEDLVDGMKVS